MVKIYLPQKKIHFGYNGQINSYRYIDLARTKYNYIMITASKSEYFKLFPHTYSFNNVLTFDGNDEDITSGVIMLMLSVQPPILKEETNNNVLFNGVIENISSCKKD